MEIGTYCGESAIFVNQTLNNLKIKKNLFLVDPYEEYALKSYSNLGVVNMSKNITSAYFSFINTLSSLKDKKDYIHIRQKSSEAFGLFKDLKIKFDLIYIDGLHHYEAIKNDFYGCKKLLRDKNSILCGDDYEISLSDYKFFFNFKKFFLKFLKSKKKEDSIKIKDRKSIFRSFHPGISLFFSNKKNIKKYDSGFWSLEKY